MTISKCVRAEVSSFNPGWVWDKLHRTVCTVARLTPERVKC